jgi:hypothetical protein
MVVGVWWGVGGVLTGIGSLFVAFLLVQVTSLEYRLEVEEREEARVKMVLAETEAARDEAVNHVELMRQQV